MEGGVSGGVGRGRWGRGVGGVEVVMGGKRVIYIRYTLNNPIVKKTPTQLSHHYCY